MSKVSCDIIKDLLPSYMEEICSEDTKAFVNCHLKECEDCQTLIQNMQKTELVSEQTEQKVVNSVRKVKKHIYKITSFGILLGLIGIGMVMLLEQFGMVPILFYLIVMPILLVDVSSILSDYSVSRKGVKWNIGFCVAEVVLVGYSILLEFFSVSWIKNGTYPFGIESNQVGLFFSYQFWISTIVQGGFFAASMWVHIKKRISCLGGINGAILGICINLVFLSILGRMDTLEGLIQIRNQTIGIILVEWSAIVIGLEWIAWVKKKNS